MLEINVSNNQIFFGKHFSIVFKRTLRIPNDGKEYPLPAGLGTFPIYKVSDYIDTVPFHWIEEGGGVFIPMYQSEALWIDFIYPSWRPHVIKIGAGYINVVNGQPFAEKLAQNENDYMVCPKQPWLDGFNIGNGIVRQFVATPLGTGQSVEAQLTGEDKHGGLQIIVYSPKPGLFPDKDPYAHGLFQRNISNEMSEMGLAAGGKITQKIYEDRYGYNTWDTQNFGKVEIHIINSLAFQGITGLQPPASPISLQLYKDAGLPWYKVYDDEQASLAASTRLKNIKPSGD
ncbi:MAG: hypothetical protein Q7U74_08750 [Saprospiraceae bacterium]|nr:hypothetical protein [Saprospiraceae bacterium]